MPVTTPRPVAAGGRREAGCGSARRSGRCRHRRRHRDCSRGDCYLPTGTNTQQPPPPREPLPELPARTPGDRCDCPGPCPAGDCGGRRGPQTGGRGVSSTAPAVHPERPGQRARGTCLRTPSPAVAAEFWGSLGPLPPFNQTWGEAGTRRLTFYKTSWLGAPGDPLSLLSRN